MIHQPTAAYYLYIVTGGIVSDYRYGRRIELDTRIAHEIEQRKDSHICTERSYGFMLQNKETKSLLLLIAVTTLRI